jgi:hypothetical protein
VTQKKPFQGMNKYTPSNEIGPKTQNAELIERGITAIPTGQMQKRTNYRPLQKESKGEIWKAEWTLTKS